MKPEEAEYNIYQFMHRDPLDLSDGELTTIVKHLRDARIEFKAKEAEGKKPKASKPKIVKSIEGAAIDDLLADL
jgi:hypothetical protein